MSLILLESPKEEPVSLMEIKAFLKLEGKEEDPLLTTLVKIARQAIEAYTARSLVYQSWRFTTNLDYSLSRSDPLYLTGQKSRSLKGLEIPRSPFVDLLEPPQLLVHHQQPRPLSHYRLDTAGRVAKLHICTTVSGYFSTSSLLQLDFKAGYGSTSEDIPEGLRHGILIMVAELYENRLDSLNHRPEIALSPVLNERALELIKPYRISRMA